jgi:hypothetical protein
MTRKNKDLIPETVEVPETNQKGSGTITGDGTGIQNLAKNRIPKTVKITSGEIPAPVTETIREAAIGMRKMDNDPRIIPKRMSMVDLPKITGTAKHLINNLKRNQDWVLSFRKFLETDFSDQVARLVPQKFFQASGCISDSRRKSPQRNG